MSSVLEDIPKVVDWTEVTLTHRCNMRCFFCYEEARDNATEPSLEQVKRLMRETGEHAEQIVLCGREVLLRSDVTDIVRYGASLDLQVVVFTNGQQLARDGLVEELVEAGCRGLAVSFHFPDPEGFARGARVSRRGFERTLKGLRNVRDYNLAHPERSLPISTESDMFSLNVGRLEEMRDVLYEALRGAPWRMRLAALLPCKTYDIGLDSVLDSLDERREEIAEIVRTQPEDVPLGFVKVPLCILPEGLEHRSLDVQYVYEGTVLSFNHAEAEHITLDEISISSGRDIAKVMRSHPYRWVCRSCALASVCRFERTDWSEEGFTPSLSQRPVPYRPAGPNAEVADLVGLPTRSSSVEDALKPLGGDRDGIERAEVLNRLLGEITYPEEQILEQLLRVSEDEPRLVDAWSEPPPVLALTFEVEAERVSLHLGVPGHERAGEPLGALVGYLDVRPIGDAAPSDDLLRTCVAHLQRRIRLPAVETWAGDPWFDPRSAWLLQDADEHLGGRIWPGVGAFGSWRTTGISLTQERSLLVELEHGEALRGAVEYILIEGPTESGAPGRIVLQLRLEAGDAAEPLLAADCEALMEELGSALSGSQISAAGLAAQAGASFEARFDGGRWQTGLGARPRGPGAGRGGGGGRPSLHVSVVPVGGEEAVYSFHVAAHAPDQPHFRRIGDIALWYDHADMDKDANEWARAVMGTMKYLGAHPPGPENVEIWRKVLQRASEKLGLSGRFGFTADWSG